MILIYTLLLTFLGTIGFLIRRRAASLEKKHVRTAGDAEKLLQLQQNAQRPSNSKVDVGEIAKRQYLLGQLVQKRDNLEAKHHAWLVASDRFGTWIARVRQWKGRKLPYTMGVLDVSGVLCLIDYLGVGQYVNLQNLMQVASSLVSQ